MKLQVLGACSAFVVTLACLLGPAHAMDVVDVKKAPDWYASEVVEVEQGQPVKRLVFSTQAAAISMVDLNRILAAYGLSVIDAKRAPAGHMVETRSGDRGDPVVTFDAQPRGLAAVEVDGILAAYGLHIVDAAKLPGTYGRQITRTNSDGTEVKDVALSPVAYGISPAEWHQILSAYGK